jgi:hypothetical protein
MLFFLSSLEVSSSLGDLLSSCHQQALYGYCGFASCSADLKTHIKVQILPWLLQLDVYQFDGRHFDSAIL